jgi:hypothetical protein
VPRRTVTKPTHNAIHTMKKKTPAGKTTARKKQVFPRGWNQKRVQKVIDYYESQTEDEALAEYEAGMQLEGFSVMLVPTELVPEVRRLIGRRRGA